MNQSTGLNQKVRIVIVEDELIIAEDLRITLEKFGYEVCAIEASADKALASVKHEKPNVVLIDIALKGVTDGIDTAKFIRENWNIPVIFLTSNSDNHTIARAKLAEPYGMLFKPYNSRELYGAIENALHKHSMEMKLMQSENKFRMIAENVSDVIYTMDFDTRFTFVSPSCKNLFGYTPEEAQTMTMNQVLTESSLELASRIIIDGVKSLSEYGNFPDGKYVFEAIHKNGSHIWIETKIGGLFDHFNNCIGILGVARDVSDRVHAEKEIKLLSTSFASLIEKELFAKICEHMCSSLNINAAFVGEFLEEDNKVKIVGGMWDGKIVENIEYGLKGSPCENVIGKNLCYFPDNVARLFPDDKILEEEKIESYCGILLFNKENKPLGIIVLLSRSNIENVELAKSMLQIYSERIALEIQHKKTFDELKRSEEKFRFLFENIMDGIMYTEPGGKIFAANEAACKILQMTEQEIISVGRGGIMDVSDPRLIPALEERARNGHYSGELTFIKKDGTKFPVELTSSLFSDKEGNVRANVIFRDITERVKNIEEIKQKNEFIYTMLENAPIGFAVNTISDGKVVYVGSKFEEIYGLPRNSIQSTDQFFEQVYRDPVFREKMKNTIIPDIMSGDVSRMRWDNIPILLADGSTKYISAMNIPLFDQDLMISVVRDVTENYMAQKALAESEEKFKAYVQNSPLGIFIVDEFGNYIDANPAGLRMFGFTQKEFLNMNIRDILAEESIEIGKSTFGELKKNGSGYFEFTVRRKNQSVFWISINAVRISNNNYMAYASDITERINSQKELKESEERFKKLFDYSPDSILVHQNGRIIMANPSALKLLKAKSFNELAKKSAMDLVHPDFKEIAIERIKKMSANLEPVSSVYEKILCVDGTYIDAEIASTPITINGKLAFQVIGRDISDRKKMEDLVLMQRDLNLALISAQSLEESFDVIFNYAKKLDGVDCGGIYLMNHEGVLELKSSFGLSSSFNKMVAKYGKGSKSFKIVEAGKPFFMKTKKFFKTDVKNAQRKNIKVFAAIPFSDDNKIIGSINLASTSLSDFTEEQKNIISSFGLQVGTYINRIAAEIELKRSEERYKRFFDEDLTADFKTMADGTLIDCNNAFVRMFEFPSKEHALATSVNSLYINPTDRLRLLNKLTKGKKLELYEIMVKTIKGKEIIVIENIFGEFNEKGKLISTTGYLFDITDIRKAELALKESEKKFRSLFDSMQNGFALFDVILNKNKRPVDAVILELNKAYEQMFEVKTRNVIGKTVSEIFPHTKKEQFEKFANSAITGKPVRIEYFSKKYKKYFKTLVYSPAKMKFAVIIEDVTESKKNLEKINQLSTAVEQSPVSVVITDVNGSIEYVNKQFTKLTGYKPSEILGQNPRILSSGVTPKTEYKKMWRTILSGQNWNGIFYNKKKNGQFFWESVNISPLRDSEGNITHFIAVKEDISEKVKVEAELEIHRNRLEELVKSRTAELDTANKKLKDEIEKQKEFEIMLKNTLDKEKELSELKSRFISTTSHEFRTPLTSVLSSAELIQRYGRNWSDEKFDYHTAKIKNSIEYLTHLLDDVLTISRSDSGKIVFDPVEVNLDDLCVELVDESKARAKENHSIIYSYDGLEKEFLLDPKLIRFIVTNLLSNAIKYSPKGGKIKLNVRIRGGNVEMNISDEGIGVPVEDRPYLFEPFHRGQNTIEIQGTGLGLSIVKRSIDLHQGEIKFETEIDKGTRFTVLLPIFKKN